MAKEIDRNVRKKIGKMHKLWSFYLGGTQRAMN